MIPVRLASDALVAAFAIAASLFITAPSGAHGPADSPEGGLAALVRASALIAHGRVADVSYRSSEPSAAQPRGVPHTFVTYEVKEILRGDESTRRLVLRIPGGADGAGGIFMPTTSPMFARGQEDVLFVAGGAPGECQLIGCVEGRFRVVEGRVYNGWGVPVAEAGKRLIIAGRPRYELNVMELPRPSFEALLARPDVEEMLAKQYAGMTKDELKARYEREAPERQTVSFGFSDTRARGDGDAPGSGGLAAKPVTKFAGPISLEEFATVVRDLSKQLGPPKQKVVMADPKQKFRVDPPRAAAVRAEQAGRRVTREELRELESMLEGGDGKPQVREGGAR